MKKSLITMLCAVTAMAAILAPEPAAAGPVAFVVGRTEHFVHRTAYRIDRHVVEPARRVVVNHTPRVRRIVHHSI